MTPEVAVNGPETTKRYRLPGIEREGIAQLSLLETALWPLQGAAYAGPTFATSYAFTTPAGRQTACVTVRAGLGLQPIDEYVLWGLLGATLSRHDADGVLLATPYWLLKHLGLATGGSQYAELRDALLRLAVTSYQNTGFYNPQTQEHEFVAFQFLSILLPTVGGAGETVDNDRCWRIEWNPAFFRFCRATGGNLLFDLDLYRRLTPAARRLFLKLKDRFWRTKRVFLNVAELTVHGLGFAASRPLAKRKYDLTACIRELLELGIVELGRGHADVKDLFLKRGKGVYVVQFFEGPYFRRPLAEPTTRRQAAISDDPLYQPLRQLGVDEAGIRRLLTHFSRGVIQRWVRVTEAALHEAPRDFPGFKVSPAAFLVDGIQHNRLPPDWLYAHEKRQAQQRWAGEHAARAAADEPLRVQYAAERAAAWQAFLVSPAGRRAYAAAFEPILALARQTDPHASRAAADAATRARLERVEFDFPEFAAWRMSQSARAAAT